MSNTSITALTGTAGGTNVPMADMSSAAAEVSVVTRDAAGGPYRTVPLSSLIPPSGLTEFDFIIRSRADLVAVVAPVANTFVLPNGSYFIKTSFALNAGEGMQVPAGGVVFLQGGGAGKSITGGSAVLPCLRCLGTVQLLTVQLIAAVGTAVVLDADGDVSTATQCVFTNNLASASPVVQTSGTGRLAMTACRITAQDVCLRHAATAQRLTLSGCRLESVDGTCVEITAAASWMDFNDCIIRTTSAVASGQTIFLNAAGATLWIVTCEVASGSGSSCMLINSAKFVGVQGGEWQQGVAAGACISVAGAITQGITLDAVQVQVVNSFITYASGAIGYARVSGCSGQNTVTTLVNWPVANIPTRGLHEQNNSWNATTANMFLNHQQNDARVMRRSNISNAGNTSETGIVP